jgi:hypothetical protein
VPPEVIEFYQIYAEIGAAFDRKDYDTMVAKSEEWVRRNPMDLRALAVVASACACKYAASGDESFKAKALEALAVAAAIRGVKEFDELRQRIQHRLQTREIITLQEFRRRFPNGWKAEEAKP